MALERFGVSMDAELLQRFDERIGQAGYSNRSEAIRDIVRDYLVQQTWETDDAQVVGTLTLVYDHHVRELDARLTEAQHDHQDLVICTSHVHLDHHNCLEVIVLSGPANRVRNLAEVLRGIRGVKHGELTCTTAGEGL